MHQQNPDQRQEPNPVPQSDQLSKEVITQINDMSPDELSAVLRAIAHRIHSCKNRPNRRINP